MRYLPTHDTLSLSLLGRSVAHPFVQKALLQLKETGYSLFYSFELQGSEDFHCKQKKSHIFPTAFQSMKRWYFSKYNYSQATLVFILPLLARLWCIHTRGQQLNCDWKNAFIRIRLFDVFIYDATLDNAWIFLLAFLHWPEMWSSKESLWPNLILIASHFYFYYYSSTFFQELLHPL